MAFCSVLYLLILYAKLCIKESLTDDYANLTPSARAPPNMVTLVGGIFQMGITDHEGDNGESPPYRSAVKPFRIDKYLVTNQDYLRFSVSKPKYETDPEIRGWSLVFRGHLDEETIKEYQHHEPDPNAPHMIPIKGAYWKAPYGVNSNISKFLNHPVVHISKRDAAAYCFWRKKRLPSEFEWEFSARGGLDALQYPWGDHYETGRVNLWQGDYPFNDTGRDGYAGTSPVDAFKSQNKYDLYDMVGNVWEWTLTQDHYRQIDQKRHHYVIKGASYLDSRKGNVNLKARISTRDAKVYYYAAGNLGFRCAQNAEEIPKKKTPDLSRMKKITKKMPIIHSEL